MAGPFSSQGGVPDIPAVQLRGGFAPDPGIAGVVKDALAVALPAIRDNHIKNLKEDVTGQTNDIETFLKLSRNPSLLTSEFGVDAIENPAVRSAFAEFVKVRDASEQGILPQQFALERLAVIQNTAISNAPEFEREIRAAMLQATGQDPQKTLFAQLLSTQAQTLSPEQKGLNDLRRDAFKNGLTVDQQVEVNHQGEVAKLEMSRLNRLKATGQYSLLNAAQETNNRAGSIMLDTMSQVRQELLRSGSLSPEFMAQIGIQAETTIAASIAAITAGAKGVSGTDIAAAIAPLEKLQTAINGMLKEGSMQALLSSKNVVSRSLLEGRLHEFAPELAAAFTFGGPQGMLGLIQYMEKAPNPATGLLLRELDPKQKAAFLLRQVALTDTVKQYGLLGTGVAAETAAEKNARLVATAVALGTPGLPEDKQIIVLQEMAALDEELAWTSFGSRKVVTATTQSKSLQAAFINMQTTQTAGLSVEYLELSSTPGVDLDRFEFLDGTLSYRRITEELKGVNSDATSAASAFASRFNRANNISALHSGTGTLPATRYGGTKDYWEVVTKSARDVIDGKVPEEDTTQSNVIAWGEDENGNPIRIK